MSGRLGVRYWTKVQWLKKELGRRVDGVTRQLAAGATANGTPQARQALRKVLAGGVQMTPINEAGRRGRRFSGQGTFGRLLTGEGLLPPTVVPPG